MADIREKKERQQWTLFKKWTFTTGDANSQPNLVRHPDTLREKSKQYKGSPESRSSFVLRIACIRDNVVVFSEKARILCIKDSLYYETGGKGTERERPPGPSVSIYF